MNEPIPMWWLVLSGVFFCLNIIVFCVLGYLMLELIKFQKSLQPKITELTDKVNAIATKVDDISEHVRETVTNVGGHAKGVAGSADIIAHSVSSQFERFAPVVTGLLTVIKIARAVREMRQAAAAKQARRQPVDKRPVKKA